MADVSWEIKCREEDLAQRRLENERRAIDDARRLVDEKASQLRAISDHSALLAGFAMVVMVEVSIPEDIPFYLLLSFAISSSLVVVSMLTSMLNATLLLVAILRYDCVERQVSFREFWHVRCESDFQLSLRAFTFGVPVFMATLAQIGWMLFWEVEDERAIFASASVTLLGILSVAFWFAHTSRKWTGFLMDGNAVLYNAQV